MDDTPAHWGCGGRDRMVVGLKLPMQSVPITTNVVSSNLDQGEVYNIMSSSLSANVILHFMVTMMFRIIK